MKIILSPVFTAWPSYDEALALSLCYVLKAEGEVRTSRERRLMVEKWDQTITIVYFTF